MDIQHRIDLLTMLGKYMVSDDKNFEAIKRQAEIENPWFIRSFIDLAVENIANNFLNREKLENWIQDYPVFEEKRYPKKVGIVMAGNIPLVGFHDFLSVFISGNAAMIKPSGKDQVLIKHLTQKLCEWDDEAAAMIEYPETLKNCNAYICTGGSNAGRYFEYYFGNYPSIIRKNKTSTAILTGSETTADLDKLSDDIQLYFGLGCRNVTQLFVPENYDFIPLLSALEKYNFLMDHNKYKNNFDYQLALMIMNSKPYMTNNNILLLQSDALFAPVSVLNYSFYDNKLLTNANLIANEKVQCIVGEGESFVPFGQSQIPQLNDFADGVNTLAFLADLS